MADQTEKRLDKKTVRHLQQALTAQGEELFQVVRDASPEVIKTALRNPNLHEDHIHALLKRRDLTEHVLQAVHNLEQVKTSHKLKLGLVRNPVTPGPIVLSLLPHLRLFELVDLCYIPGVTPDQKFAAERAILKRLPTTELGHRLTLARRATPAVAAELLKSGEIPLVEICLNNPRLREVAVLQFLNGSMAKAATISMVARHPKWKTRPNLQLAILKNRATPPIWYNLFLPQLRTADLRNLLASRRLDPTRKKHVQQELSKRSGL